MQGHLNKLGAVHKAFRRRFFVLLSSGKLCYFLSDESSSPKGVIHLGAAQDVRVSSNPRLSGLGFDLIMPNRTYVLFADSATETDEWLAAIRAVARRVQTVGPNAP
jgi:hypothetical protein